MGVRKTHNRVKSEPIGKDLNEVVKKAKIMHEFEFFIFKIDDYYMSEGYDFNNTSTKHFKNINGVKSRKKWIEV